jgi:hypothetical protein
MSGDEVADREVRVSGAVGTPINQGLIHGGPEIMHDIFVGKIVSVERAVIELTPYGYGRRDIKAADLEGEDKHACDGAVFETVLVVEGGLSDEIQWTFGLTKEIDGGWSE